MVTCVGDLAVFGGTPLFRKPLHVGQPNLPDRRRLFERLEGMLDRGWLTNDGPLVPEFEAAIARRAGTTHCVATCNATTGLELTIRGLGLSGEVIVPAFTFVAPVHALAWSGITPVFCDIDPVTHLLDPGHVETLVTNRTTGILAVHMWGQDSNTEQLCAIADRHHLALIFDAAHAFGCRGRGGKIGGRGNAEIFSFHATKIVNAFEGGAVVTNDATLANRLRLFRSFGFAGPDRVESLGVNAKMSEASAAMGLTSVESLEEFAAVNRRNYIRYFDGLRQLPGVTIRAPELLSDTTLHYVVVEIDGVAAGFDRDLALRVLSAEGVLARRYFYPGCHRMEPYRSGSMQPHLVATDRVCAGVLQLPTGTSVRPEDIDVICEVLRYVSANAGAIRARLPAEVG